MSLRRPRHSLATLRPLLGLTLVLALASCQGNLVSGNGKKTPGIFVSTRVLDTDGVGIWTVEAMDVFPQYGGPEVVGLDDRGRCWVIVPYSGRWTAFERVHDGSWLGGLAHGELDPRVPGKELYVGSESGNIYQIRFYSDGALDARRIALLPGREVHTLLALPGRGLLAFTEPGGLWLLTPERPNGEWQTTLVEEFPGRIRDSRLLRLPGETGPVIATASRAGTLRLLRFEGETPRWQTLLQVKTGIGRLDRTRVPGATILYAALDDGRILRLRHADGDAADTPWERETIYAGPLGARGVAAGHFSVDPTVDETVAVFGYSRDVVLLSRRGEDWSAETIWSDSDKGHWLATAELDGRNGTDELLASGYSGRITLLARPPGYGLRGVPSVR